MTQQLITKELSDLVQLAGKSDTVVSQHWFGNIV